MPQRISVLLLAAAALTAIDFAAASQPPLPSLCTRSITRRRVTATRRARDRRAKPSPPDLFRAPQPGPPVAPCFASSCATDNGASRSRIVKQRGLDEIESGSLAS